MITPETILQDWLRVGSIAGGFFFFLIVVAVLAFIIYIVFTWLTRQAELFEKAQISYKGRKCTVIYRTDTGEVTELYDSKTGKDLNPHSAPLHVSHAPGQKPQIIDPNS